MTIFDFADLHRRIGTCSSAILRAAPPLHALLS